MLVDIPYCSDSAPVDRRVTLLQHFRETAEASEMISRARVTAYTVFRSLT
jgi:hypothetical protein